MPQYGPPPINPALISGLLDPMIKERREEQLGQGVGAAFQALQSEDYPAMARALQAIGGESPQTAIGLIGAMNTAKQRALEERRIKMLEEQGRIQSSQDAEGFPVIGRILPGGGMEILYSANPDWRPGQPARTAPAPSTAPAPAPAAPAEPAPVIPSPPGPGPAPAAPETVAAGGKQWPVPTATDIATLQSNKEKFGPLF